MRAATTVLALLMIANLFVAYAIASVIIAGAIILGGIGIGLWLGHNIWEKPADERIEELEQQLQGDELEILATLESSSLNEWGKSRVIVYELGDAVHYGRNYAWALAKYEILKALEQGDTLDAATSKARSAVYRYYLNVTRQIISEMNSTAKYLNFTLNRYTNKSKNFGDVDKVVIECWRKYQGSGQGNVWIEAGRTYRWTYGGHVHATVTWRTPNFKVGVTSVNVLGSTFKVLKLLPNISISCDQYYSMGWTGRIAFKDCSGKRTEVYNWNKYRTVLNQINNEYNTIVNNINAYVQGLQNNNFNITDLIDPYVLATFLDKDWNATGYYGYAAAELALLGLNTTGLDYTITINLNGKNISGFLFTDWTGTLEVGRNYTVDNSHVWYLITSDENGQTLLVPISPGTTFTITSLRDWQGNPINSTNLTNYNPHSGEIEKIYEELKRIEELYEEYINNLQTAAGGSSFNFSEWWNSLDTTAQLGLIAIGCVAVYAILRRS